MNGRVIEEGQNMRCLVALINAEYLISDEIKSKNPASDS
jgi:hypothetical protein